MENSRLLTAIELQHRSVDQLGDDFTYPLFNSRKALESQRQSGYRTTAAAAREIVDNAIEAGATKVHVIFDKPAHRANYQRKDAVTAVAFIDNGSGMIPKMARFALSWGGGSHFDDPDFIGKFGFGLPNASINQSTRVEVYTRTSGSEPFVMAWLDISEYTGEGNVQTVQAPVEADLPDFVQRYLKVQDWSLEHGTVVVWSRPDHLTYATAGSLREHLMEDFGATYRNLLNADLEVVVAGKAVEKVDPLFLDPTARFYRRPDDGGAILEDDTTITVKYAKDAATGERYLEKAEKPSDLDDPNIISAGQINIRVARFPLGFVVGRELGDGITAVDEHAKARFEIRKSRRGMSFVRAGREIETVDVFPRRASDVSSGLGDWPLLQAYAYHWGIEVKFPPALDEVFGITNDKQTVRPIEDFWRLLKKEEYDDLLHRQNRWQSEERKKAKEERDTAKLNAPGGPPSAAENAAQAGDAAMGEGGHVPDRSKAAAQAELERRAREEAERNRRSIEEARAALENQALGQRYDITFVEDAHGPFYEPVWVGRQLQVRVNKLHPFFSALYGTLVQVPGGGLAKEAVDLLLFALAREEKMTRNEQTEEFYRTQRTERWSPYLASAARSLTRDYPEIVIDEAA